MLHSRVFERLDGRHRLREQLLRPVLSRLAQERQPVPRFFICRAIVSSLQVRYRLLHIHVLDSVKVAQHALESLLHLRVTKQLELADGPA